MEPPRNQLTSALTRAALAALLAVCPLAAASAEVLVYKAENKWVAPEDNKPLQALLKAARSGKSTYAVRLPQVGRPLAIARLEILQNLLTREAKTAIVMEEVGAAAKPNTLEIQ